MLNLDCKSFPFPTSLQLMVNTAWLREEFLFIAWAPITLIFFPSLNSFSTSAQASQRVELSPWTIIMLSAPDMILGSESPGFSKSLSFSLQISRQDTWTVVETPLALLMGILFLKMSSQHICSNPFSGAYPSIEQDLPEPVCPQAKMVELYPLQVCSRISLPMSSKRYLLSTGGTPRLSSTLQQHLWNANSLCSLDCGLVILTWLSSISITQDWLTQFWLKGLTLTTILMLSVMVQQQVIRQTSGK